jgi:hypothetical protein
MTEIRAVADHTFAVKGMTEFRALRRLGVQKQQSRALATHVLNLRDAARQNGVRFAACRTKRPIQSARDSVMEMVACSV